MKRPFPFPEIRVASSIKEMSIERAGFAKVSSGEERSLELAQEIVEAPITGTVISIEVNVGDKVEEGDELLYIESMKMENPIMAPVSGTVTEIKVTAQQVVETGNHLATLEF